MVAARAGGPCRARADLRVKGGADVLSIDHWVQALAAILLLAGITEMLLPAGPLKGYARSLLGLLVLLGVLQPVVGVLKGNIRLDLPALLTPAASGTGAAAQNAAELQAVTAYERLVAAQAARMAEQVPGVQAASATLRFAPQAGAEPAVQGAAVEISPTTAGLAQGAALSRQVQSAVAAGLDLAAASVSVSVW